ncbi:MAG: hypothetical protein KIT09_31625 [Bryobacteraceae bacterium]|nr:hypothetical protein [Bryobacteraceae bacterium]
MPPGVRWTIETGTGGPAHPNLAALQREVVVDYVLFADDSQWGPDVNQQSAFVRAVLYGAAGERRRLRSVLESEGVDKLLEDLSREAPRHRVRPGGK